MIEEEEIPVSDELVKTLHMLHDRYGRDTSQTQSVRGGTQVDLPDDMASDILKRKVTGAWSVRLRDGGYHQIHNHPKGQVSGVLYIDVPDPDSGHFIAWENPFKEPVVTIKPRQGLMLTFPSYMWHGTSKYEGEGYRLTVAFDQ